MAAVPALPVTAWAQAANPPAIETIVVTAQKREQNAQAVGVALSVLSGDELSARGVRRVNQLQSEVPSLEIEPAFGGSQAQFRLRGVGFQDYATNNAGAVTVYLDDVALPLGVQTQGLLFDVERVEVLRGPQGTLYGRNTTGGAINFISRAPTARFEGGATLGLGSFGAREGSVFVSGPLAPGLRGRVAFSTQQGGGWQRNRVTGESLGDKDISGLRGQLEFDAMPALKMKATLHAGRDKSEGQGLYAFVDQPALPPGRPDPLPADRNRRNTGWGFDPLFLRYVGLPADSKPGRDNDSSGGSFTLNWAIAPELRLTSITATDRFTRRELADYDGSALAATETYFVSKARNHSQELRLASTADKPAVNWVAGVYAAREKLDENYGSSFAATFGLPIVQTIYGQKVSTASLFGQADVQLGQSFKLIVGARQERETRTRENFTTFTVSPDLVFQPPSSLEVKNTHSSGKLGIEFQPSRALLAYGSISRGVKSGGFTAYNTLNPLALTPFKPEVLIAYEAGFKADPSPALRVNAAVYHYDYRNQQILDAVPNPQVNNTPIGAIVNAPKSEINGVEFELVWKPTAELTLTQHLGYKDGKFKRYVAISPPQDLSGQRLYFPRMNWGGSVAWRSTVGGWTLVAQGDASYQSKGRTFLNRINTDYDFATPAHWLANARVEFAPVNARWLATVYVRNLLDEKVDLTRNFFVPNLPAAAAGAPRSFGVQVGFDF
jgi:outer membrane receptor protein involved in Fe transport